MTARVAVFASGTGTNLRALIDRLNTRESVRARVVLAVSDRPDARALERAAAAGVEPRVVRTSGRAPDDVAAETLALLHERDIDLIALAGYLRLVPAEVVRRYRGRIINIHPALLPAFGGSGMYGTRVHRAVLDAGCLITGVTVHHVDERYDAGRPILQWPVPVLPGDTPERLAARVLEVEHVVYALGVEWLARQLGHEDPAVVPSRARQPIPSRSQGSAGQQVIPSPPHGGEGQGEGVVGALQSRTPEIEPGGIATGAERFKLTEAVDLETEVRRVLGVSE